MLPPNTPGGFIPALASELIVCELGGEKCCEEENGEELGMRRSSGSELLCISRFCSRLRLRWCGGRLGGRGNWLCEWMLKLLSSLGRSLLLGAVGDARAASSLGLTWVPDMRTVARQRIKGRWVEKVNNNAELRNDGFPWQMRIIQINVMLKHRFAERLLQHSALIGSYLMFLMLYCNLIPFWIGKVEFQSNQGSFVTLLFIFQFAFQFWGTTLTPALLSSLEASSGSKGDGMGSTGRSWGRTQCTTKIQYVLTLVLIPLCWRLMWLCSELRDLATVPQRTQR